MNRTEEAVATARRAIAHDPDLSYAYLVLAKVFAEADRNEEAQAAAAEIQKVDPGFSVSAWAGGLPYHDPELRARQVNALLKAGLPE